MSPESIMCNKVSKESDIWSYGILLWEMYSLGCTPYPFFSNEELVDKLKEGYRMPRPPLCDQFVYDECMLACWREDPKQRPSFATIVQLLNQHRSSDVSQEPLADVIVMEHDQSVELFIDDPSPIEDDETTKPVHNHRHRPYKVTVGISSHANSGSVNCTTGESGSRQLSTSTSSSSSHSAASSHSHSHSSSTSSSSTPSSCASSIVFYDKNDRDLIQIR